MQFVRNVQHSPNRQTVTPELSALLALQEQDEAIDAIQERLDELQPRLDELERARRRAQDAVDRATANVTTEEQRQAFLREKVAEHKQMLERSQAHLDQVKSMRAATAAVSQLEQMRRVLADEESDLAGVSRRLVELRAAVEAATTGVAEVESEQAEARATIEAERATITVEMEAAAKVREERAAAVSRSILVTYERIRRKRRRRAVFPLNDGACGSCDTAIPVQRRYTMQNTGAIELCEGCGVLLFAKD